MGYSVFVNGVEREDLGKFKTVAEFEAELIKKGTVVKRLKVQDGIYGYFVTGLDGKATLQTVLLVSRKKDVIQLMA